MTGATLKSLPPTILGVKNSEKTPSSAKHKKMEESQEECVDRTREAGSTEIFLHQYFFIFSSVFQVAPEDIMVAVYISVSAMLLQINSCE